jgi:type 1 glutamine amidotransferase
MTTLDAEHPITKGLPKRWLHPNEQLTHGQHGPAKSMTVLTYAWSKDTNENEPMDWVIPYGKGRVYTTMLGHLWKDKPDTALRCAGFQTLFVRGVEWAATGNVTLPVPADFPTESKMSLRTMRYEVPATQPRGDEVIAPISFRNRLTPPRST